MNVIHLPLPTTITVYVVDGCPECKKTLTFLTMHSIIYKTIHAQELFALDEVAALGYAYFPVVVASDINHWAGHRPELLSRLVASRRLQDSGVLGPE